MVGLFVSNLFSINTYKGKYDVEVYNSKESIKKRNDVVRRIAKDSFLVIDSNVSQIYPEIVKAWNSDWVCVLDAIESNKELSVCEDLIKRLIAVSFKKDMSIVVIGGGIIQDISSFTASILYRGVDWIFLPTTLLAQSDSSIGSKTSINFKGIKNILGNFFPPRKIYCFTDFLETLGEDEVKSGIGEILHYYIIDDSNYSELLYSDYEKIIAEPGKIYPHIIESLSIKKKMIEIDEFDSGPRRVFNYGHTFGHAIECLSDFKLSHGQSVTLGMDIANFISLSMGMITEKRYKKLKKVLSKNIPDYKIDHDHVEDFIKLLKKDKKSTKGKIVYILPTGKKGVSLIEADDEQKIKKLIYEYIKQEGTIKI